MVSKECQSETERSKSNFFRQKKEEDRLGKMALLFWLGMQYFALPFWILF